jgi:hypothetical protein
VPADDLEAIFVRIGSVMPQIVGTATGGPVTLAPSSTGVAERPVRAKGPNTLSLPAARKDTS